MIPLETTPLTPDTAIRHSPDLLGRKYWAKVPLELVRTVRCVTKLRVPAARNWMCTDATTARPLDALTFPEMRTLSFFLRCCEFTAIPAFAGLSAVESACPCIGGVEWVV